MKGDAGHCCFEIMGFDVFIDEDVRLVDSRVWIAVNLESARFLSETKLLRKIL